MLEISEGSQVARSISSSLQSQSAAVTGNRPVTTAAAISPRAGSDNISLPQGDISFASLQTRNDRLSETASVIRSANRIIGEISSLVGERQTEIRLYEKQYPPFANQSSEHIKLLNSITGLKRQIDALTVVPDNKELSGIVAEPFEGGDGSVADPFQSESEGAPVREEPIFPVSRQNLAGGESGLNFASIDSNSTNADIRQFGQDLSRVQQTLSQQQAGLQEDTQRIAEQVNAQGENLSVGREILATEEEATKKSAEVQSRLNQLPGESLISAQAQSLLESIT